MKIAYTGLPLSEGKVKYNDPILIDLDKTFAPKKFTPYFFEFTSGDLERCDVIATSREKVLDVLIPDMEKLETRLERSDNELEKATARKALSYLEKEIPLYSAEFTEQEKEIIRKLTPVTLKPVVIYDAMPDDMTKFFEILLDKSGYVFFYTAGKQEVHAWLARKDADIVTCAGKIHSDLARGFIRADVINYKEFKGLHNLNEAREKGLMREEGKEYLIKYGDIIEIKFSA